MIFTIAWLPPRGFLPGGNFSLRLFSPKEPNRHVSHPDGKPKPCTPSAVFSDTYFSDVRGSSAPNVHEGHKIGGTSKVDDVVNQKKRVAINEGSTNLQDSPHMSLNLHCCSLMHTFSVANALPHAARSPPLPRAARAIGGVVPLLTSLPPPPPPERGRIKEQAVVFLSRILC